MKNQTNGKLDMAMFTGVVRRYELVNQVVDPPKDHGLPKAIMIIGLYNQIIGGGRTLGQGGRYGF